MAIALLLPIKAHVLPTISCFSPSTRLRILPSIQQTKYSLTHSTPPPSSIAASLAVGQQNRAKGKRVDRNLRSVCLSCCPPTMIDSLPRSSAIQQGTSERTTAKEGGSGTAPVSPAAFLAAMDGIQTHRNSREEGGGGQPARRPALSSSDR